MQCAALVAIVMKDRREDRMYKWAIALLLFSAPGFAQDKTEEPVSLQSCYPIGQTVRGELIYSLDCKAITPDYTTNAKPVDATGDKTANMPSTEMKASVIPRSATQAPEATPTKRQ
jgi:hypothetical protein